MCDFSSGYRPFTSYWWRHWFRLRTYTHPFVFAYQRVFRGWADCDVWHLDGWLTRIIPPALEHLRDTTHGYPAGLSEVEWAAILTDIADGFRAAREAQDIPARFITDLGTSTGVWARLGMTDKEYDWEGIRKYQDDQQTRFELGMTLFTEYFHSLWD